MNQNNRICPTPYHAKELMNEQGMLRAITSIVTEMLLLGFEAMHYAHNVVQPFELHQE